MKNCKGCGENKPASDFYSDKTTRDGLRGKCKACLLNWTISYRQTPKGRRVTQDCTRRYQATPRGQEVIAKYVTSDARKISARKHASTLKARKPAVYYAYNEVAKLRNSGRLKAQPCEVCGEPNAQGHHEDYSKPLDLTWLCREHHLDRHREMRNV